MTITAINPARVVVLLTSIVVTLVLLLAISVSADADDSPTVVAGSVTYVVQGGDTLWDIAVVHTAPGDDVRDLIHDIREINDLDTSMIIVGQVLEIPVSG